MRLPIETPAETIVRSAKARAARRMTGPTIPQPKAKRRHPKRHSVNGERSKEQAAKAAHFKQRAEENLVRRRQISAIIKAYFAGEISDLSALPR